MSKPMKVEVDDQVVRVEMTHDQFRDVADILSKCRPPVDTKLSYHAFVTGQRFVMHFKEIFEQLTLRRIP